MSRRWARRWLEAVADPPPGLGLQAARGSTYHRSGRVVDLRVEPGLLAGRVQGSRSTPYSVRVEPEQLGPEAWADVVRAIAGQARHSARLLAGLAPDGLEEELAADGIHLFPPAGPPTSVCECADPVAPCAHAYALWQSAGERISGEPAVLLRLRGRGHQQLLAEVAALRRRPGAGAVGTAVPVDELDAGGWWSARAVLEDVTVPPAAPPPVPAPALRLAGDPPGWSGGVGAWDLLRTLVERAGRWAEELADDRYRGERPDSP